MGRERKIEMENLDDIFMFQLVANDAYECWRLVKANVARTWPACDPLQVPSFHCCQWPQLPNRKSKAEYSCLLFSSVLACNFHSYHKASVRPCIFTSYSTCRFDSINNKRSTLGADTLGLKNWPFFALIPPDGSLLSFCCLVLPNNFCVFLQCKTTCGINLLCCFSLNLKNDQFWQLWILVLRLFMRPTTWTAANANHQLPTCWQMQKEVGNIIYIYARFYKCVQMISWKKKKHFRQAS